MRQDTGAQSRQATIPGGPNEWPGQVGPHHERAGKPGQPACSHRSRVALRSLLRSFRAAYPRAFFPPPQLSGSDSVLAPVEDWQFVIALRHCDTFRHAATRLHTRATLLLARAGGLDGHDMRWVTGAHIARRPQAGTWITITAPRAPREVAVLRRYAPALEDLALARPDTPLIATGDPPAVFNAASVATGLINRSLRRGGYSFAVSAERLRKAWLIENLAANTPINTLLAAAGLKSLRSIEDLVTIHGPAAPTNAAHLAYELGGIAPKRRDKR